MTMPSTPEQQAAADTFVRMAEAAAGSAIRQLVEHLIRGGEEPVAAVRLAGPAFLTAVYGPGVLEELGLQSRTARQIRTRISDASRAAGQVQEPSVADVQRDEGLVEPSNSGRHAS